MLHHRTRAQLMAAAVSSVSLWIHVLWKFSSKVPGKKRQYTILNWEIDLGDGQLLTDAGFEDLLDSSRRFIWSLYKDRRNGKNLMPESFYTAFLGLKRLLPWMIENNYASFDELTVESADEFVADLIEEAAEAEADLLHDRALNKDDFIRALRVWVHLHQQGPALIVAGINIFTEMPFNGRSTYDLATELAEDTALRIPPLPDEVAMPILAAAIRIVSFASADVIRLQEAVFDTRAKIDEQGRSNHTRITRERALFANFEFSILPGEAKPWHSPIDEGITVKRVDGPPVVDLKPANTFRNMVATVRDACVAVIQGLVGVRINEVCSFEGGLNEDTGLPTCVEKDRSVDGLEDLYYVRGILTKGRAAPEPARWLLGSRPVSGEIARLETLPLPVIALTTLERLYRPWRELGQVSELIVNFTTASRGVPVTAAAIGSPSSETLLAGLKNFVLNQVDLTKLPDNNWRGENLSMYRDSFGAIIRTHQWRKTFAHYALLTRSNLLQAVSQHFKHLSLAMTEQGYLIDDPFLRGMLGEAAIEASVDFFYHASFGEPMAGKLGDAIEEHREEVIALRDGKPRDAAKRQIRKFVTLHDMRIFHMSEGRCGIRINPLGARCHQLAGTSSWANREPNYATREPSVCLGCKCFGIDRDTAPFWQDRWERNSKIYRDAEKRGQAAEYRVAARRAEQAEKVIKRLTAIQN